MRVVSVVSAALMWQLVALEAGQAQTSGFVPGSRALFDLNLAGTPVGEFPVSLKLLTGNMEVVQKDGAAMLKASSRSEFLVRLPEFLPDTFTVEFDVVPKACCNPEDLAFEGTRAINQGNASARIQWDSDGEQIVVGGGEYFSSPMPEELKTTLPGVLTQVAVSFEGGTIKLYTNGKRLYTLSDRKFVRGRVLRVFLGGQDDAAHAVHLAKLRIATNSAPWAGFASGGFVPGKRTLFDLDMKPDSLGTFPKQLRAVSGPMAVVMHDGVKMLKASNRAEFRVPLPQILPQDFTLEFELTSKECCQPQDLSFEGTPAIDQGAGSAHVQWWPDALKVFGGGESIQDAIPEGLALATTGVPASITVSADGLTMKFYVNGRRLATWSDRRFARGRVLRVFLGGQDGAERAVYLAKLRIATNSPPP